MYSAERRQEILSLIAKRSRVSVDHLASYFGVSHSSIRRDLSQLHEDGLITRTYGGAVALSGAATETPFTERQVSNFDEKDRIGKAAAQLVEEGETIFIDGGTTTECMIPYLMGKRITVVTYGLNIVNRLSSSYAVTVIASGGALHQPSLTFNGVFALNNLQNYNIRYDKTFMAASGVSLTAGVTNASLEEIPIKRKAIEVGQHNVLLVDASKIGVIRAGLIAPLTDIQQIISSEDAPCEEIVAMRNAGVAISLV
ncbi:MAG: DeoR/GlpR transcriptional regulator [Caldilineaceae bacterium]|nr:DeoR/GlpR transcriptional regulator [Caldilineaceae bacterium]